MGCCCSSPPPHTDYAPDPGLKEQRKCHDVCFLIAFIIFWVGMFIVADKAVQEGDPIRLLYGYGYDGNVCGSNNDKLRALYPSKAQDLTDKKFLYYLPGTNGSSALGICVEGCPEFTYTIPTNVDEILCPYYVTPSLDLVGFECWGTYASQSLIHRCVPFLNDNITQELASEIMNALNVQEAEAVSVTLLGDIVRAWQYIAVAAAVAICLAFLWLVFLRWFAGFIVWSTIILVIVALAALAYELYVTSHNLEILYAHLPIYARLISKQDTITIMKAIFWVLVVVDGIIILVVLCMCHRIGIAVGVIKEVSKVMLKIPTMLLVPIFTTMAIVPLAVYFIYIGAYLGTAGTPTYDADGNFVGYESNQVLTYMLLYYLFGAFWTLNFRHGVGECVVAGAVGCWYWVHDKKDVPSSPVLRATGLICRYHLGSVLFGAMILSAVQFLRFLLQQFEHSMKGKETVCTKFVFKCAQCVLSYFERFIKFLNENAYIMVSIYGYSFCEGARRGFSLIAKNLLRVAAVNCVTTFLIFLGKLAICIITTLVAFLAFTRFANENVDNYMLPLIVRMNYEIISLLSYAIAVAFFGVFAMAVETLLLCFCEDAERNDGSPERPYYMSHSLQTHLQHDHTCALCCNTCC